jgi:hypothetical protein
LSCPSAANQRTRCRGSGYSQKPRRFTAMSHNHPGEKCVTHGRCNAFRALLGVAADVNVSFGFAPMRPPARRPSMSRKGRHHLCWRNGTELHFDDQGQIEGPTPAKRLLTLTLWHQGAFGLTGVHRDRHDLGDPSPATSGSSRSDRLQASVAHCIGRTARRDSDDNVEHRGATSKSCKPPAQRWTAVGLMTRGH